MATLQASVEIDRPLEAVVEFLSVKENDLQWQKTLVESSKTSDGPWAVGSTGREVREVMGKRIETTWVVTKFDENKGITVKSTSGPVQYEAAWSFETSGNGGTKFSVLVDLEVGGFLKLVEGAISSTAKSQMELDLRALKDLLEGQQSD